MKAKEGREDIRGEKRCEDAATVINTPFIREEEEEPGLCCAVSRNTGLWQFTVQGGATESPEETPPHTPS